MLEDLVERPHGSVGEIDDDSAGGQVVHQRPTAVGQPLVRGVQAPGEGVRNVVSESDHAHTDVPEMREGRRIFTEGLHAFHREEEPDAAVRGGQILSAPHLKGGVAVLVEHAAEGVEELVRGRARLLYRPAACIERADLQSHPSRTQLG